MPGYSKVTSCFYQTQQNHCGLVRKGFVLINNSIGSLCPLCPIATVKCKSRTRTVQFPCFISTFVSNNANNVWLCLWAKAADGWSHNFDDGTARGGWFSTRVVETHARVNLTSAFIKYEQKEACNCPVILVSQCHRGHLNWPRSGIKSEKRRTKKQMYGDWTGKRGGELNVVMWRTAAIRFHPQVETYYSWGMMPS